MNKNTVWAIVLSALVIGAYMFVQVKFFPQKKIDAPVAEQIENQSNEAKNSENENAQNSETQILQNAKASENLAEEIVTIETDTVKATFTNRGGDIVSFELLKHIDTDISRGVQMADNVSATNRALSLALGDANASAINDVFAIEKIDEHTILFTKKYDGFTLGKRYTFHDGEYMFKLDILFHADDAANIFKNELAYTLRTPPQIGPHFDTKKNRYESRNFLSYSGETQKKKTINVGSKQFKSFDKNFSWAGIAGKYFEAIIVPENPETLSTNVFYSSAIEMNNYANAQAFLSRKKITANDTSDSYFVYFGPRNEKDLKAYNVKETNSWQLENVRLNESMQSSGWLGWLENILKVVLEALYKVVHNWGVSIIVMTILLKLALFPITMKQSMSTQKMQKLQPQMQAIQTKYKDNPQRMQAELGKLYKENNYSPVSGCLPMLFQFLIIFAMFNLFNNYFEFRGASFIPGWIPDLSAGDSVYTFKKNIPLLSNFIGNSIRILPIIYLLSQLFYGKITMNGGTAAATSAGQMKFMMYGMPLLFFFIFYNAPAGLLLYWTVSNFIQMAQQLFINKFMKNKLLRAKK